MWSYIYKAINNDLQKPLNDQIGKLNDVNGYKFTPRMEAIWSNPELYSLSSSYTITDIKYDSTHIYIAVKNFGSSPDGYIYKFSKTDYSYIRISADAISSIAIDNTHIFAGSIDNDNVKKYLKSDMSYIGATASYGSNIYSICINDTHLFVAGLGRRINKYLKSDLSYVTQSDFFGTSSTHYIRAIALGISPFDPGGVAYDMIFAVGDTNIINNYNIDDMTLITSKTETDVTTFASLTVDNSYVYAGNTDKFIQYTDGLLAKISTINSPADRLYNDSLHVYAKGGTTGIKKYLKSDFSIVSQSDGFINDIFVVDGNNIYAGKDSNVMQILTEKTYYDGYNIVKKITSEQDLTYNIKHFEIDT